MKPETKYILMGAVVLVIIGLLLGALAGAAALFALALWSLP